MNNKQLNKELRIKILKYLGIFFLLCFTAMSLYFVFGYENIGDKDLVENLKTVFTLIGTPTIFFILNAIVKVIGHKKQKDILDSVGLNNEKLKRIKAIKEDKTMSEEKKAYCINKELGI